MRLRRAAATLGLGVAVVGSSMLPAVKANADPLPSIDLRTFHPPTGPGGTLFLEPVNVPGAWSFDGAAWLSYAREPVTLRQDGAVVGAVVRDQVSLDPTLHLGLGKRVSIGATVPLILAQRGDKNDDTARVLDGGSIASQAIGDVALTGKMALIPTGELGGFGLGVVERLTLPTGARTSLVGEGSVTSETRLLAELRFVALGFQATAGYLARTAERDFANRSWGDAIPWGFGITLKPQMLGWDNKGRWTWGIETHGYLPAGPDAPFTNVAETPLFVGATTRYVVRDVGLLFGIESGLTHAAGAPPFRGVIAVTWGPRSHDQDGDGIDDDKDECPPYAEDKDGFQDEDGCPDTDNDDDGLLDSEDKCPNQPEDMDDFQDEDGCPDPDNDQDGILDTEDACPNVAGPRTSDPKTNGCPPRAKDPDGDGVIGGADKCPQEAEDKDGFQDEDGCPDPDNDQDGILDAEDACPNEKGQHTDDPKTNGCPSRDSDGDAILNDVDKCPNDPETYNGFEDEDGCPEPPKKAHPPLVAIVEKKGAKSIVIAGKIGWKKDLAELDASGAAIARAVAQVLTKETSWSVVVAVRAAPNAAGEELSSKRAEALAEAIRRGALRVSAAHVAAWTKGKMAPDAEVSGTAITLVVKGGT